MCITFGGLNQIQLKSYHRTELRVKTLSKTYQLSSFKLNNWGHTIKGSCQLLRGRGSGGRVWLGTIVCPRKLASNHSGLGIADPCHFIVPASTDVEVPNGKLLK